MTMHSETLQKNSDGSDVLIQYHKFWETANKQVMNEFLVLQGADKTTKVEIYKKGIANTIRGIKFADFEATGEMKWKNEWIKQRLLSYLTLFKIY